MAMKSVNPIDSAQEKVPVQTKPTLYTLTVHTKPRSKDMVMEPAGYEKQ